jgi:hypothetical protein
MKKSKMTFERTQRTAQSLGKLFEAIEKVTGYNKSISGKGRKLLAIATTLDLVRNTPNARINGDAMDAWQEEVEEAQKVLRKEARKLSMSKRSEEWPDEIPF